MHFSALLLPLLAVTPAISAARVPPAHGSRRNPHPSPDFEKIRREGTAAMEAREGIASSMKGKRLVRKKRSGGSSCQQPFDNTTLSSSTSSSSSSQTSVATSSIGQNDWAAPSSTASSSSSSSTAATPAPTSNSDWKLSETWVSRVLV